MGISVTAITNTATTLVTGRCRGRTSSLSIQIGRVVCWPAVKVVTLTLVAKSGWATWRERAPPGDRAP